jgi:ABC-type branched-subunit amino acid transport system substrate-binding protein
LRGPPAQQATIDDTGPDAAGMFASVPGRTPGSLKGPGKELVSTLESELGGDTPVELFAPYSAQAADLLLQAIESGASRSEVIEALFGAKIENGIVGSFEITRTGDPSVSPISVSEAADAFELSEGITPEPATIDAARGS